MNRTVATLSRVDWLIFLPALLLSVIGLAAIGSVGLGQAAGGFSGVTKQSVALALGIAVALGLTVANYRVLDHYARAIYLGSLALLVAVLFLGSTVNGTKGWFIVGGWGFQPVEFAKIAFVIILARFVSKHSDLRDLRVLMRSAVLVLAPVALIMLQPDFGGAMGLLGIWFVVAVTVGMSRRHLLAMAAALALVAAVGWGFLLKDYQKDRILTFLDPARAPLSQGYNTTQAKIAIGSGGLFGRGLGYGSQSQLRFLPEAQTDFIFAVVAEELGFVAVAAVFGMFALLVSRALRLARKSEDNFTLCLTVGFTANLAIAAAVNAGMNLGLLPVTGIALPFLSAGGTSLLSTWLAIGLLESVAARTEGARGVLAESAPGVEVEI